MLKRYVVDPYIVAGLVCRTALLSGRGHQGYVRSGSAYQLYLHLLEQPVVACRSLVGYGERTVVGDGIERHEGSRVGRVGHRSNDDGLGVARTGEGA